MRFSKLDLLTLLISLFVFASCEKTSTIGLEVDPNSAVSGKLSDTSTIFSRTILEDDAVTYGTGSTMARYPLGFLNDPMFGTTEASLALSVNLPSEAYSFGTNPVLDSAVLVLNYSGEFYGDSTVNYSIDVHQLTNNLAKETSYLSSKTYPSQASILGSYTGKAFPTTPFKVIDVLTAAPDTLMSVSPQVRIKLDNAFFNSNIVEANTAVLKYNSSFQNAIKGLNVKIKQSAQPSMGKGGMMFFDFASNNSKLMLYYRKQNATTSTTTDTVSVGFPIATGSGPVAASIKRTFTSAVQAQLDAPNTQFPATFLQPLGGLRNKISFPYLSKFKQEAGKIAINKAELVIDLSDGSTDAHFKAAPRLALYRYDIAEQRRNIPDNDVPSNANPSGDPRATPAFGGYFDSVNKRYVFVITAYIQDLIDGKTKDYGTFLAVTPNSTFEALPSYNTASRAVIGSFKKNPAAGDNLMKINIYYSSIE
jgi:hypothetical protein